MWLFLHKNIVFWDIICYLVFPLVVWNFGREIFGDYYAMLISSVPGIIYSILRFIVIKKVNVFGIFMISNLTISTLVDVLSGSAIQMLWNNVYYGLVIALFFILTIVINKPLFLYLSLDFLELQGHNRQDMKDSFYQKKVLLVFKFITFGLALREIVLAAVKGWLILDYGVEAFDKGIILRQVLNWGITGISMIGFVYVFKLLNLPPPKTPVNKTVDS